MKRATKLELAPLLDDGSIGLEGRLAADDHQSLKVWLRLLSCSTQIETEIKKRLRAEFGMTLARFDYLAQLQRHPDGLRMNALSRYLMVTGGNVTGLTDELVKEGLVERRDEPEDRRSWRVALTAKGHQVFARIAAVHESWVVDIFAGMGAPQKAQLHELLGGLRVHLNALQAGDTKETER
ncbi:MAG TPA: MarR family transcriptional regulator [Methylibium sp.]|uniref:MarR family winged helix-turn-helix transcriptional regulator n=1 Tax=Methylibium sp. TaxID=2067992 RepID=UPI002DBA01D4|nr:MarR family transcriptional regulator [Methylibium sp.]HEU4460828.1 MarR family transcriptional regulator [Methylibium sp.]